MSGGVDSSVAACLLKEQGYEVIGLFMRTGAHASGQNPGSRRQGCCSALDAGDARRVADRLGIPFYALDFEDDFGRVMDYFADEYLEGRTPNPCIVCNNWLKFGKLWSYGHQLGADWIATGHYAQIVPTPTGPELHRGRDPEKDQSYVLFGLRRSILERVLFPVGGMSKDEVRTTARRLGLAVADKPDSVEICFVGDNDHARFIHERRPNRSTSGNIIDRKGQVLAGHSGIENFTVGQRKRLGFAAGSRRYVLEILPQTNEVVIGEREELLADGLVMHSMNWLIDFPAGPFDCAVKIRYRHLPTEAEVESLANGEAIVRFRQPQPAVTPGQAVVFYDGRRVLGGGWIARPLHVGDKGTARAFTEDTSLAGGDRSEKYPGEGSRPGFQAIPAVVDPAG
jgi:tRNA-specific 2-thiouridylase